MGPARRRLLSFCAMLMVIAVANAASSEVGSVVVGLAKCADCTRKNMKAEAAFKGLRVVITCKNINGEYKSNAVGELQSSGAFSVPLSADMLGADCLAQLHSAAGTPCPGQEPSMIWPLADGSFVAIPESKQQPSAECASVIMCGRIKKHLLDHFYKKPEQPKPKPEPENQPPTPTPSYDSPPSIYNPPTMHLTDQFNKEHELDHFLDHFHKKPVPPKPEPKPRPQPEYHPPTPTNGSPTPTDSSPTPNKHHFLDYFHKGHHHYHFFDHFHKKPVPPEPKPEPQPDNNPTTPSSTPIYPPPTPLPTSISPPAPLPTPIYPPPTPLPTPISPPAPLPTPISPAKH